MSTLVQVVARVTRLYNKTTCVVDVHLTYSDGTSKKFDKGNSVTISRSVLPSMYLYASHYCDPAKIEDGIPTRFNLSILKTVLDPESSLPPFSHKLIAALVKTHARSLWAKDDERWNYTTDQCIRDMSETEKRMVKSNEDFAGIPYPSIRKAAYEILGRPHMETVADRIPLVGVDELSKRMGPNAGILAVALAGGVLPADMTVDNTLCVSPCKATAEYFVFYTALPAVSYQVFMGGFHVLAGVKYVIIERCAAYTERELHTLMGYLKRESTLTKLIVLAPTPALAGVAQTYYRGCTIVEPPTSVFLAGSKAAGMSSASIDEFFKKTDSATYKAGDCVSLITGRLAKVQRVAEIVSGFPTHKEVVSAEDPASRVYFDGAAHMIPRAGHRVGYYTTDPIIITSAADPVHILRMACVSLSGECYVHD